MMLKTILALSVVVIMFAASVSSAAPNTRRRISVDLVDADIRNVLRLFADVADVNLVFGEEVTGRLTLRLKRVRWDRALSAILRTKGLEMHQEGNIIRVARLETFARERQARIVANRQCRDDGPLHTRMIRPAYAQAVDMAPLVRAHLKSSRGTVSVDKRTNTLIIRDVVCR